MEQTTFTSLESNAKKICFVCCKTSPFLSPSTGVLHQDYTFNPKPQRSVKINISNSPIFSSILGSENLAPVMVYLCDDCTTKSDLINRLYCDSAKIHQQITICMLALFEVLKKGQDEDETSMKKSRSDELRMKKMKNMDNLIATLSELENFMNGETLRDDTEDIVTLGMNPEQHLNEEVLNSQSINTYEALDIPEENQTRCAPVQQNQTLEVVQIHENPDHDKMDGDKVEIIREFPRFLNDTINDREEPLNLTREILDLTAMRNPHGIRNLIDNLGDNMDRRLDHELCRNDMFFSTNQAHAENLDLSSGQKKVTRDKTFLICHVCGRKYLTKSSFEGHLKLHDGIAVRLNCAHCESSFRIEHSQKLHLIKFHPHRFLEKSLPPETTEKKFELAMKSILLKIQNDPGRCLQCLKHQNQKQLKVHVLRKHINEVKKAILEQKLKCEKD